MTDDQKHPEKPDNPTTEAAEESAEEQGAFRHFDLDLNRLARVIAMIAAEHDGKVCACAACVSLMVSAFAKDLADSIEDAQAAGQAIKAPPSRDMLIVSGLAGGLAAASLEYELPEYLPIMVYEKLREQIQKAQAEGDRSGADVGPHIH